MEVMIAAVHSSLLNVLKSSKLMFTRARVVLNNTHMTGKGQIQALTRAEAALKCKSFSAYPVSGISLL